MKDKKPKRVSVSERTARTTIAFVRVLGRSAPPPEGVITPTLLMAADQMEQMLEELIERRSRD